MAKTFRASDSAAAKALAKQEADKLAPVDQATRGTIHQGADGNVNPNDIDASLKQMREDAAKFAGIPDALAQASSDCGAHPPTVLSTTAGDRGRNQHKIQLGDGRKVLMGPPTTSKVIILAEMFNSVQEVGGLKLQSNMQLATVLQYVRMLDNAVMPGFLRTWPEVVALAHDLGDLAIDELYEAYGEFYGTQRRWSEIKN